MSTAPTISVPRRLTALVVAVVGASALLVLAATPAAAHPGHGAEAGHEHAVPLVAWAVVVVLAVVVGVVGMLRMGRARSRRLASINP